jgi:hypothetical protein
VLVRQLRAGEAQWSDVREGWAITATLVVFLGWGVALGVTTAGYARATGLVATGQRTRGAAPVAPSTAEALPRPEHS